MKRTVLTITLTLAAGVLTSGYSADTFKLSDLKNYHKEFVSESIGACSTSSTKTYEDYRAITNTGSKQWQIIHNEMTVDPTTGFLVDEDGFIGVAMGYSFGEIGSRYYVELDTGIIIPVIKVDAKAATDASNGCSANADASVIEFVIDSDIAYAYFGGGNGLANNGNFNNYDALNGSIVDIERVSEERIEDSIVYDEEVSEDILKADEAGDNITLVKDGF